MLRGDHHLVLGDLFRPAQHQPLVVWCVRATRLQLVARHFGIVTDCLEWQDGVLCSGSVPLACHECGGRSSVLHFRYAPLGGRGLVVGDYVC